MIYVVTSEFGVGRLLCRQVDIYRDVKITVRQCCLSIFVISAQEVEVGDKEGQDCFCFILTNS